MRAFPILLVLLALVGAGCLAKPAAPAANNSTTGTNGSAMDMTAPMAVTVTVGDGPTTDIPPKLYTLAPANLALKVNMPYNLTFKNTGRGAHDLVIDKLGVKVDSTPAGGSKSVTFTPTQTGTFDMYCTLGMAPADHRSGGMAGKVTVS